MSGPPVPPAPADARRAELSRLLRERAGAAAAPPPAEGPLPLSHGQRALWLLHQLDPGGAAHNVSLLLPVRAGAGAARRALELLAERHPLLRSVFPAEGGEPVRRVRPPSHVGFAAADARGWDEARLRREVRSSFLRPVDLAAGPVLRGHLFSLGEREGLLLVAAHHLVVDAVSLAVIQEELAALLGAAEAGTPPRLPPPAPDFAEHVRAERAMLEGPGGERLRAFWRGRMAGGLPEVRWPAAPARGGAAGRREALGFALDPRAARAAGALAAREGATPFVVLLAAFAALLHRYTGQETLPVGTATAGARAGGFRRAVGYFANPVVLLGHFADRPSFRTLVRRLRGEVAAALDHDGLPFPLLVEELRGADAAPAALFQVMFMFQRLPSLAAFGRVAAGAPEREAEARLAALHGEVLYRGGHADLSLELLETEQGTFGALAYDAALFPAARAARMAEQLARVLLHAAAEPDRPIDTLPLLSGADDAWPASVESGPPASAACGTPIHRLFEAQADRAPGRTAVEGAAGRATYGELEERANRLANHLARLGVRPGARVALVLDRSPELALAMLAVLKAGAAYVPLDPAGPAARTSAMLRGAGAAAALTRAGLAGGWAEGCGLPVVRLDADRSWSGAPAARPAPDAGPRDCACVVHTSGSTGTPRGVQATHRGVVRLLRDAEYVRIGPDDRVAHLSSPAFDAATFEVWGALLNGAALVVVEPETVLDPRALASRLRDARVTVAFVTTALLHRVADESPAAFAPLRTLLFGGEAADPARVRAVLRSGPPGRLVHVYGPTECTVFATWHPVREVPEGARAVPIGRPVEGTEARVLDAGGNPVPPGVPGELHLGGEGLAAGYLGCPERTAERFVPHPTRPGARLYRTGDLALRDEAGDLVFLGRSDGQAKVRGFRVEPGEVEAALARHAAVGACAVRAWRRGGESRLAAYVVPAAAALPPGAAELRAWLRERLPEYMVPASFQRVEALPMTSSGKVDRAALPPPEDAAGRAAPVPPRDEVEAGLAALWEEVLDVRPVGIHDSFFDLGGHSLLTVRLLARIEEELGRRLPLAALFETPTVAGIAGRLRADAAPPGAPDPLLVPLRAAGARPPLFFVPGLRGDAHLGLPLARRLDPDQPVYAFHARGLEGRAATHHSVEEIAAAQVEAMRRVQPQGPYTLLGYSLGGVIAWEMAQQLRAAGSGVELLVLLDALHPGQGGAAGVGLLNVGAGGRGRDRRPLHRRLVDGVRWRARTARQRLRFLVGIPLVRAAAAAAARAGVELSPRVRGRYVRASRYVAFRRYTVRSWPGPVVFLRSGRPEGARRGTDLAAPWAEFAEVEVREAGESHEHLMEEPSVAAVAAALLDCLSRRGGAGARDGGFTPGSPARSP